MEKQQEHTYIAIDLKSFYASVECVERSLDPLKTNLVVADAERSQKTIVLAVSPALKSWGLPGRPRLFEVAQKVKEINGQRTGEAPGRKLTGSSTDAEELRKHSELALDYIVAVPRMALYMDYSTRIYQIYLKYVAPEDIHIYSVDEVFMDVTHYLNTYRMNARQLAMTIITDILNTYGITATAGIAPNLYLAKVAMDIEAKHIPADENGVRIAELDERSYREKMWAHRPLTDFWRVGRGYVKKLEQAGLMTMGDIARCSMGKPQDFHNEELLYKMFGINAELLIDHAWGWEPCTIADIKAYKPENTSVGSGQVLHHPYEKEKVKLVLREMTESLMLDLCSKRQMTDQLVLNVGYDISSLEGEAGRNYKGEVSIDRYGRRIPKHAQGTAALEYTSSSSAAVDAVLALYDRIVDERLLVRRLYVTAARVKSEEEVEREKKSYQQMDLFSWAASMEQKEEADEKQKEDKAKLDREKKIQQAMLDIRKKFGSNAILKAADLQEGATAIERGNQIGGHRA